MRASLRARRIVLRGVKGLFYGLLQRAYQVASLCVVLRIGAFWLKVQLFCFLVRL